jgi:hypothetical protein
VLDKSLTSPPERVLYRYIGTLPVALASQIIHGLPRRVETHHQIVGPDYEQEPMCVPSALVMGCAAALSSFASLRISSEVAPHLFMFIIEA